MEKLEIKLTLTADSTPDLLRYLRGISSARDRAFILKRLATVGLSAINGGASGIEAALLAPPPAATFAAAHRGDVVDQAAVSSVSSSSPPAGTQIAMGMHAAAPAKPPPVAAVVPMPPPTVQVSASDTATGFELLDLDALNAATAQFV